MITITDDQQRRLTSHANVKVAVAIGTKLYLITAPSEDVNYGFYNSSFDIDSIEESIGDLGGLGESGESQLRINNVNGLSDMLDMDDVVDDIYLENTEVTMTLIIDDTDEHVLMKSVVENQEIDDIGWTINLLDESEKFNVPILTEVTLADFADAPDESIGAFLPIHYGQSAFGWNEGKTQFPAINVQKGNPKLIVANHECDWAGIGGDDHILIYNDRIEWYSYISSITNESVTNTGATATFATFDHVKATLTAYSKFMSTDRCVSIVTADIKNLVNFNDDTTTMALVAGDTLSIQFKFADLGQITDLSFFIFSTGAPTGTPLVRLWDVENGAAINETVINAQQFEFEPDVLQFNALTNHYLEIECETAEALEVYYIYAHIEYQPFDKIEYRRKKESITFQELGQNVRDYRARGNKPPEGYMGVHTSKAGIKYNIWSIPTNPFPHVWYANGLTTHKDHLSRYYDTWMSGSRSAEIDDTSVVDNGKIKNAIGIIESIVQDEIITRQGLSDLDIDVGVGKSFDLAYDKRRADAGVAPEPWQYCLSLYEQVYSKDLINQLAFECASMVYFNYEKKLYIKPFDSSDSLVYYFYSHIGDTEANLIDHESQHLGKIEGDIKLFPNLDLYDKVQIHYAWNPGRGVFEDSVYVDAAATNWDTVGSGDSDNEDAIANCLAIQTNLDIKGRPFIYEMRSTDSKETAERLCFHINDRRCRYLWYCEFNTGLEGYQVQMGDFINIQHPRINGMWATNYATKKWVVLGKVFDIRNHTYKITAMEV